VLHKKCVKLSVQFQNGKSGREEGESGEPALQKEPGVSAEFKKLLRVTEAAKNSHSQKCSAAKRGSELKRA